MSTPERATLELDCRGQRCPLPVIELARRIHEIKAGEVVAVVATDVAAGVDIPAWCRMRGQDYLGQDRAPDGAPRYLVRCRG